LSEGGGGFLTKAKEYLSIKRLSRVKTYETIRQANNPRTMSAIAIGFPFSHPAFFLICRIARMPETNPINPEHKPGSKDKKIILP
jgi:hypothetical protein